MLTPAFDLSQDAEYLFLNIRVLYTRTSEFDLYIDGADLKFYAKPYFLRLTLPGKIVEDGREKASFDIDKGLFSLRVPKETPGEDFEGLQMLTSLLAPRGSRSAQPLVQEVAPESSAGSAGGGGGGGEEEEEDEEFDWEFEQEVYLESSEEELRAMQKYGFGNQRSGVFARLQEELSDVIDVEHPDRTTAAERRHARLSAETSIFCHDHYLADLFEDEQIQGLLKFRPWWTKLSTAPGRHGEAEVSFTDDEKEQLRKFTNRSYVLDAAARRQAWLGLADVLLAYAYGVRTTEGEHNVESPWTLRKLSGTLCWLETYGSVREVMVSFGRRALCYPLHRHFDLVTAAARDVALILQSGKACVLKCLLDIHRVFRENEPAYILNDLYITDYCVWIQRVKSRKVTALAEPFRKMSLRKKDLDLELGVLEAAAMMVVEEEEEEERGARLKSASDSSSSSSSSNSNSSSSSSSSSSSEESEESEEEGQDSSSKAEGGGGGGGGGESARASPPPPPPAASLTPSQHPGAALPAPARPPSAPAGPGPDPGPRRLIQELGERVEEGLWISPPPSGSAAQRDAAESGRRTEQRSHSGTFLEPCPRKNPLLVVGGGTEAAQGIDEEEWCG